MEHKDWLEHLPTLFWVATLLIGGMASIIWLLTKRLWCREVTGPIGQVARQLEEIAKGLEAMKGELFGRLVVAEKAMARLEGICKGRHGGEPWDGEEHRYPHRNAGRGDE